MSTPAVKKVLVTAATTRRRSQARTMTPVAPKLGAGSSIRRPAATASTRAAPGVKPPTSNQNPAPSKDFSSSRKIETKTTASRLPGPPATSRAAPATRTPGSTATTPAGGVKTRVATPTTPARAAVKKAVPGVVTAGDHQASKGNTSSRTTTSTQKSSVSQPKTAPRRAPTPTSARSLLPTRQPSKKSLPLQKPTQHRQSPLASVKEEIVETNEEELQRSYLQNDETRVSSEESEDHHGLRSTVPAAAEDHSAVDDTQVSETLREQTSSRADEEHCPAENQTVHVGTMDAAGDGSNVVNTGTRPDQESSPNDSACRIQQSNTATCLKNDAGKEADDSEDNDGPHLLAPASRPVPAAAKKAAREKSLFQTYLGRLLPTIDSGYIDGGDNTSFEDDDCVLGASQSHIRSKSYNKMVTSERQVGSKALEKLSLVVDESTDDDVKTHFLRTRDGRSPPFSKSSYSAKKNTPESTVISVKNTAVAAAKSPNARGVKANKPSGPTSSLPCLQAFDADRSSIDSCSRDPHLPDDRVKYSVNNVQKGNRSRGKGPQGQGSIRFDPHGLGGRVGSEKSSLSYRSSRTCCCCNNNGVSPLLVSEVAKALGKDHATPRQLAREFLWDSHDDVQGVLESIRLKEEEIKELGFDVPPPRPPNQPYRCTCSSTASAAQNQHPSSFSGTAAATLAYWTLRFIKSVFTSVTPPWLLAAMYLRPFESPQRCPSCVSDARRSSFFLFT